MEMEMRNMNQRDVCSQRTQNARSKRTARAIARLRWMAGGIPVIHDVASYVARYGWN